MSTLVFPYPRTWETIIRYTLTRVDDPSDKGQLVLNDIQFHRQGHNSSTYLGNLYRNKEYVGSVVCKLAFTKKNLKMLRHEASVYQGPLKELQDEVVPLFYGLYEGEMEDEELTGCLITQFNGRHRKEPLNGLPWELRLDLISALMEIHDAGVLHGDFAERNVIFTESGTPFMIDFGHATTGHKCERKMDIVLHAPRPDKVDFGCDELYEACRTLWLWTPPHITYLYRDFPVEYAKNPEMLASFAPESMSREHALSEARASIYDFAELWNERLDCNWWH